jgi:cytochrome c oxidase cbb3-type subunit 4
MDINTLRIIVLLVSFGAFLLLWRWAWSRRQRPAFDAAAQLPFAETGAGNGGEAR